MRMQPVTLEGQYVRLEPLTLEYAPVLWQAGKEAEIWRWLPHRVQSEDDMRTYIQTALHRQRAGTGLGFVTIAKNVQQPVGATTYLNVDAANQRLEIGATWITPAWQRSAINTEAKYLQLCHAFEALGCIRVEFKTDSFNVKSRQALARIGATEEGIFRNHMLMPDGRKRHSVYFSIIDSEWPAVKTHLAGLLARYTTPRAVVAPAS
jgi:N-acetyltransferase